MVWADLHDLEHNATCQGEQVFGSPCNNRAELLLLFMYWLIGGCGICGVVVSIRWLIAKRKRNESVFDTIQGAAVAYWATLIAFCFYRGVVSNFLHGRYFYDPLK
jgi:hypothetical protein